MKINFDECWVVSTTGFMLDPSTPDWVYTTKEEAQAEADEQAAHFPTLFFTVHRLPDLIALLTEQAHDRGMRFNDTDF